LFAFIPNDRDSNRAHRRKQKDLFPIKFHECTFFEGLLSSLFLFKTFSLSLQKLFYNSLFSYLQNRMNKIKKTLIYERLKNKLDLDVLPPLFEAASIDLLTLTIATGRHYLYFLKG